MRGGLRARLVLDSTRLAIIAGLAALGWFDGTIYDNPPGPRRHQPLEYVPRPKKWDDPIYANALAISLEDIGDNAYGLGGEVEDISAMYVDIFAESDTFGWNLAMDVRDILLGKCPDIGRASPTIDVYDLRMPTPAPFTQIDVERVFVDRAGGVPQQWHDHWFMVRLQVTDDYLDEFGAAHPVTTWTDELAPAWARIQSIETYAP